MKGVNPNGGAIALGHPLGATGTRLVITAMYELIEKNKKYAITSACIGGGMGIGSTFEESKGVIDRKYGRK